MAIQIDYVTSWYQRLRGRLQTQFRGAVTWDSWCQLLGDQFQDLEDAIQSMFSALDIDYATGTQLDLIGRVVGQPRNGVDDATYRLYLKARIAANRSSGDAESLYAVFTAMLGAIGFVSTTSGIGVKAFAFRIKGVITRAQALVAIGFLRDAKEAGARGLLEWQESATSVTFVYDGTTAQGYDAGLYAGALQA